MPCRQPLLAAVCFLLCAAYTQETPRPRNTAAPKLAALQPALDSVRSEDLLRHIRILASDEFEGRAPGSRGEELTVKYLTEQFRALGLKPGNPDGAYVQKVPLAGFTSESHAVFVAGKQQLQLKPGTDYVAVCRRAVHEVKVDNSDLVFVGYGVVAPEYGWDDYKGVDVRGKTLVMLINDPAIADPDDPSKLDESMFKGRAMTYYGRWTYKYEIASEQGAAAAIIIHETGPAGYPFQVVSGSWGRENFDLRRPDKNLGRVAVESWINLDTARNLLKLSGHDFETLKAVAVRKDFKPVPLGVKASFAVTNTRREVDSQNVVALLEGSDATMRNEYLVYSAHWDHLGKNEKLQRDPVFNGALDNASGVAALLELAEAFTRLKTPPKRSVLFLSVTAEEKGLLGAKHYAENPLYPLVNTVANTNIDGLNQWGRTKDVVVVGLGNSTLDDVLAAAAQTQNRVLQPDPEPEKGFYYRSDHFEFAKQGVPALYANPGTDYAGKPAGYGQQKRAEYTSKDYHKVTDEVKSDWDLSGAVEDIQLLFQLGWRVAESEQIPEWKPGTEFKARREAMLKEKR
ncbi:MAG: M20/M25/M40 family metallo-hydrolase [Acidimicrobiia bacterium]|nr:M20/M25/M40 family metallo-hydrolase [Acidimicrobiia bacterium]